jgi:hypothetical protein
MIPEIETLQSVLTEINDIERRKELAEKYEERRKKTEENNPKKGYKINVVT